MTTENLDTAALLELEKIRQNARCLYAMDDVVQALEKIAVQLNLDYADKNPIVITVMNGGVVFAGKLLPLLTFPLQLDYVHATRYLGDAEGGEVQWLVTPGKSLADRDVLILDDILDVGTTLSAIIESCRNQGARSVRTAVLVDKKHDRKACPDLKADYTALETGDQFLFGCGMDYKGYWRNAPGIFSVDV